MSAYSCARVRLRKLTQKKERKTTWGVVFIKQAKATTTTTKVKRVLRKKRWFTKGMFVPLENFFFSLSTPPPEFGEEEWKEQEKKKKPEYNHDDNHRLPFSC